MRVLHVIVPEPDDAIGGGDRHVLAICRETNATFGPVVEVFSTLSKRFAQGVTDAGGVSHFSPDAIRVSTLRKLVSVIRHGGFDVVHSHGYESTWLTLAASRLVKPRPKFVVTCHGWIENTRYLRFASALDRACNRWADAVVSVGHNLTPAALDCAVRAKAFAYIPNGVQTAVAEPDAGLRTRLGIPADAVLVGAMGRLSPEKGFDQYIDIAARVCSVRSDVHFVLAGGGPERETLLAAANRSIPKGRFSYLGVTDRPEELLATIDIFIQPSELETTSRVLLEAMTQRRPVIASDVGSTGSIITSELDGILVPKESTDAFVAETLKLADDAATRSTIGEEARRRVVSTFSLGDMAGKTWAVYQEVLGNGQAVAPGSFLWRAS